jgi:membrane protein DedA with SNARE-associated domain
MPEDIVLITAGVLGAQNNINVIKTIILMYCGIILGDGIIFIAGRLLGYRLLKTKLAQVLIHPEKFGKVQSLFGKWGRWVIFVGRFLPGLRTPIFFTAGTLKYSPAMNFIAVAPFVRAKLSPLIAPAILKLLPDIELIALIPIQSN